MAGVRVTNAEDLVFDNKHMTEKARSLSPESQNISNEDASFELNTTYNAQSAHPIAY